MKTAQLIFNVIVISVIAGCVYAGSKNVGYAAAVWVFMAFLADFRSNVERSLDELKK